MEGLGYYAKDKDNNLFQFEWASNNDFFIIKDGEKVKANPKDYEILEIGHFTADSIDEAEMDRQLLRFAKSARSEVNVPLNRLLKEFRGLVKKP